MNLSPKRAYAIAGLSLAILWIAMAAWMFQQYSHRYTVGMIVEPRAQAPSHPRPSDPLAASSAVPSPSPLEAAQPQECTSFFNIPGIRFYSLLASPHDTFRNLALRFRLNEETIRSLNQANSRKIEVQPEDLVLLPSKDGIFHMVLKGQGLSDIASAYGVSLKEVLGANRKSNDDELKPGEILYLPHGHFLWDTDPTWLTLKALSKTTGFIRPISARFSDAYGQRLHPIVHKEIFHGGLDLAVGMGTPVMAIQDGQVIFEGPRGTYGNLIILDHGSGITSFYGHLSLILVRQGQKINRGDVIGKVGKTGRATGPHLHFEIRKNNQPQNPLLYIGK